MTVKPIMKKSKCKSFLYSSGVHEWNGRQLSMVGAVKPARLEQKCK